jgi:hypothetical protein
VTTDGAASVTVDHRVEKNFEKSYYEGQVHPYEMILRFRAA